MSVFCRPATGTFKIAGRGMPMDYAKESYLYFLVKDEHKAFIKEKVDLLLERMSKPGPKK